jgi:hypothetical protein
MLRQRLGRPGNETAPQKSFHYKSQVARQDLAVHFKLAATVLAM